MTQLNKSCCFCDQVVLGAAGCDAVLDTVVLDEKVDQGIIDQSAYGLAHASCLHASGWSHVWHNRIAGNLFNDRHLADVSCGERILGWNDPTSEFAVLDDGMLFWISNQSIFQENGKVFATFVEEVCWPITNSQLVISIERQIQLTGMAVATPLVMELSSNPSYLKMLNSALFPYEDDFEATMDGISDGVYEGRVKYAIELSDAVSRHLAACHLQQF